MMLEAKASRYAANSAGAPVASAAIRKIGNRAVTCAVLDAKK
jgi:hypothetical protein